MAASHLTQFEIAGLGGRHPTVPLAVMLRRLLPARKVLGRGQRNPMDFKYLYAWIISRSLSSEERSPPLASGWWRFTSAFETSLDVLRRGAGVEAERIERLAFGIVHGAGLSPRSERRARRRPAELTEHAKRIVGSADFRMKAGRAGPRRWPSAVHAHLPGRAMADDRLFLILRDVVRVHPGEEIVGLVVLPHVIEAEPPIFPLTQPPFGRAVSCGRLAVRPIAGRGLGIHATIFVGLYPDAVEQGESFFMTDQYARAANSPSSLDKYVCALFARADR